MECDLDKSVSITLASPLGSCAIGVIQVAGDGGSDLVNKFFKPKVSDNLLRIKMGDFCDANARIIDRVLVVRLPNNIIEITTHGGVRIVQRIIETLKSPSASLVESDELIPQTFMLSGDDAASRAYELLPKAKTTLAVKFLLAQAHGGLSDLLKSNPSVDELQSALKYWPAIKALIEGAKIVIAGPPNSGKSTLLNSLSQSEHAIVADLAGTTRDYIQSSIDLDGLPVELIDTAGLGTTSDPLAEQVEAQTIKQLSQADIVLLVLDATNKLANEEFLQRSKTLIAAKPVLALLNKTDRPIDEKNFGSVDFFAIEISALEKTNLQQIAREVWKLSGLEDFDYSRPTFFYADHN